MKHSSLSLSSHSLHLGVVKGAGESKETRVKGTLEYIQYSVLDVWYNRRSK